MPEARDGYFTTYYTFNKIILDIIRVKFDIQVDDRTITQSTLLHDDIPGYNLPIGEEIENISHGIADINVSFIPQVDGIVDSKDSLDRTPDSIDLTESPEKHTETQK